MFQGHSRICCHFSLFSVSALILGDSILVWMTLYHSLVFPCPLLRLLFFGNLPLVPLGSPPPEMETLFQSRLIFSSFPLPAAYQ